MLTDGKERSHHLYVQVLIEMSLLGWKEYELEVMRDLADNVVIICSIENLDPMGVHTGDSITIAPAQTLTDKEYQRLRDAAVAIIREMGVECGGSNVQMAINPANGEVQSRPSDPLVSPPQTPKHHNISSPGSEQPQVLSRRATQSDGPAHD